MEKEIGGNFPLSEEQIKGFPKALPITGSEGFKYSIYTHSGRNALNYFLNNVYEGEKKVFLPSYTCDTCINPFVEHNFDVSYYLLNQDLTPNVDSFFNLFQNSSSGGIIYLQSYFGFDTLKSLRKNINEKADDFTFIEDITHSWLSSFSKTNSEYFICSFRKWLEIPDGGAIFSNFDLKENMYAFPENEVEVNDYKEASIKKQMWLSGNPTITKNDFYPLFKKTASAFSDQKLYKISNFSRLIIENTNFDIIKEKRVNNCKYLIEHINNPNVVKIFDCVSNDEIPLYYPVYIKDDKRKDFQNYLMSNDIYCPIHWPKSELVKSFNCEIYDNILSLVCDQRYGLDDMKRMVDVINEYK